MTSAETAVCKVHKGLLTGGMPGTVITSTDAETREALRNLVGAEGCRSSLRLLRRLIASDGRQAVPIANQHGRRQGHSPR